MPPTWTGTQEHLPLPKYKVVFQGHAAARRYLPCLSWPIYRLEGPQKRGGERLPADRGALCCRVRAGSQGQAHISSWESDGQEGAVGMGHHPPGTGCPQPSSSGKDVSPWKTSGRSSCQPQQPPWTCWGGKGLSRLAVRADPPFGGLQPALGCSCPNSGTRHCPPCPMGSCLAQKGSGLLVSCLSPSDTPGQL